MQNSKEGKLTTDQLRLAFSNLVRSARYGTQYQDELAWHCVDSLRKEINNPELASNNPSATQHKQRLTLTLISLISAVPLRVLVPLAGLLDPLVLDILEEVARESYLEEIKKEIMERVGDSEKQFCLDWWGKIASQVS